LVDAQAVREYTKDQQHRGTYHQLLRRGGALVQKDDVVSQLGFPRMPRRSIQISFCSNRLAKEKRSPVEGWEELSTDWCVAPQ
jgi:hypothetical protein